MRFQTINGICRAPYKGSYHKAVLCDLSGYFHPTIYFTTGCSRELEVQRLSLLANVPGYTLYRERHQAAIWSKRRFLIWATSNTRHEIMLNVALWQYSYHAYEREVFIQMGTAVSAYKSHQNESTMVSGHSLLSRSVGVRQKRFYHFQVVFSYVKLICRVTKPNLFIKSCNKGGLNQ